MSFEIELSGTIALSLWSRILLSACFKSDSTVSSCRRRTSISWLFMSLIFDKNLKNVDGTIQCSLLICYKCSTYLWRTWFWIFSCWFSISIFFSCRASISELIELIWIFSRFAAGDPANNSWIDTPSGTCWFIYRVRFDAWISNGNAIASISWELFRQNDNELQVIKNFTLWNHK